MKKFLWKILIGCFIVLGFLLEHSGDILIHVGREHSTEKGIWQYRDTYISDNSTVGKILNLLPEMEQLEQFSLETKVKPYTVNVQYKDIEPPRDEENIQLDLVFNSTYLFALIPSADRIKLTLDHQMYVINRDEIAALYSKSLIEYPSELMLNAGIFNLLKDKSKVDSFVKLVREK